MKDLFTGMSFYNCEGKLATYPIINFLRKHGNICYGKLVDIGCGDNPYGEYFPFLKRYIGVDISNDSADIIADAKGLPFKNESIDFVLCSQVIEHDKDPCRILTEAHRILKKNGVLILSAPQMGRLHGEPKDYYRFTKWGLKYLLEKNGLQIELIESQGGIFRAIGSHLNFFLIEYVGKNRCVRVLFRYTVIAINNLMFGLLDKLIKWDRDTLGYNIIARKRN